MTIHRRRRQATIFTCCVILTSFGGSKSGVVEVFGWTGSSLPLPSHHGTTTLHMASKARRSKPVPTSKTTTGTGSSSNVDVNLNVNVNVNVNTEPVVPPTVTSSDLQLVSLQPSNNGSSSSKADQRLQEIRSKDRRGEKLSQSYCDSVLGSCVAHDEWESVLEVLDIMKRQNLMQERSTYRACLQACLETGNGASAREILQAMQKALLIPTPWDIGLTVAAMCRQDKTWWRRALALLKSSATNPEIVTDPSHVIPTLAYDVILECMVEERQWKEAVRLLRLMEDGTVPKESRPEAGYHPSPEVSTYREVIECCVGSNQAEQAAQVLYSMKDRGVKPTTYAFELVISALSKKLQWRRALQLLELMDELQVSKTVVTYNAVISACARSREVGMAKSLLTKMQKAGIRPNEVSFNSVIGACASTAQWRDALSLLDQCYREPGVQPNIYIYTNAMRACAKGGNTQRALSLLQVVKDKGLPLDTYCYTAVIDACAKAKLWKKALELLDEMQQQGIEPSEVTYSVTISACGNGGQWKKALDLLQLMKSNGMTVNVITYNAVLTALSKASRQKARHLSKLSPSDDMPVKLLSRKWADDSDDHQDDHGDDGLSPRALKILEEMRADGMEPDGFCYSSAISCCGAEGLWKEALLLIETMKKGGPRTRPNRIAYTAAISACGRAGQAEYALKLFNAMKDEGLSADRVAYNALFSALRVAGDPDKTFQLWGEICGTRSTVSTTAIATAKDIASPDIITLTDCLATLSRAERLSELDQVFREAVSRGIVLPKNGLDLQWEIDLSGMSLPVARGAVRFIVHQLKTDKMDRNQVHDMTFITGVGRAQQRRKEDGAMASSTMSTTGGDVKDPTTSLREYVQEILLKDFVPGIPSIIPQRAQGTVEISGTALNDWVLKQRKQQL